LRCRSVAPCCRPWGSPGCRHPTRLCCSTCEHVLLQLRPVERLRPQLGPSILADGSPGLSASPSPEISEADVRGALSLRQVSRPWWWGAPRELADRRLRGVRGGSSSCPLLAVPRRGRPGQVARPSRLRCCHRHTKSVPIHRLSLASAPFPQARSPFEAFPSSTARFRLACVAACAPCTPGSPRAAPPGLPGSADHQVSLAAAPSSFPSCTDRPTAEAFRCPVSKSRPRGLLPCPSPLPACCLRSPRARCFLGLSCCSSTTTAAWSPSLSAPVLRRASDASVPKAWGLSTPAVDQWSRDESRGPRSRGILVGEACQRPAAMNAAEMSVHAGRSWHWRPTEVGGRVLDPDRTSRG
jgi:hypothetical protein